MQRNAQSPLTGGMMIIVMPARGGNWSMGRYFQNTTQQIIKLSQDTIDSWSYKALPDEIAFKRQTDGSMKQTAKLVHPIHIRIEYWLNDHFRAIIGAHQLHESACTWSFQHDQF